MATHNFITAKARILFHWTRGRFTTIDHPASLDTRVLALNDFDNILGIFTSPSGNVLFKGFCASVF
ncbi:MAG TPA: hypothetical protein VFF39_13850 [Verrucomicrobiae bacterium]|nr:hypothetical protein [Verrucomicrobiae bacterium]